MRAILTDHTGSLNMADKLESALCTLGLSAIYYRFRDEKLEPSQVLNLSDKELTRLGVVTLGDRLRLKALLQEPADVHDASVSNIRDRTAKGNSSLWPFYALRSFSGDIVKVKLLIVFVPVVSQTRNIRVSGEWLVNDCPWTYHQ